MSIRKNWPRQVLTLRACERVGSVVTQQLTLGVQGKGRREKEESLDDQESCSEGSCVAGLERDACDAARERNVRHDSACGGGDV